MTETEDVPPGVDPATPSPARLYDYFLGGTNYFAVDKMLADRLQHDLPDIVDGIWANRGFHGRAAVWMAQQGISQFIDIGSGLPTQNNTHEAVQKVTPSATVAYVDIDPMVATASSALLAADGTTTVLTADVREPDALLGHRKLRALIDLNQPVGVLLTAVMHFVADESDPWGLVATYMAAVAPGSFLALSHGTYEKMPPNMVRAGTEHYEKATERLYVRSRAEIARFFDGLELVPPYEGAEPALTYVGLWGAEDVEAADSEGSRALLCGVARRP
jgi:hypothetical protein